MAAERFFQRWSRLKAEPALPLAGAAALAQPAPHEQAAPLAPAASAIAPPTPLAAPADGDGVAPRLPCMDDVAQLHSGSDYAIFMARGVDKSVQRGALKKLFADPHFNIGDGLDLYMGDYNKPDPIPAAMMSALRHTQSFFAQAYPDRKTEEDDPGMPEPAGDGADSLLALSGGEPSRADPTGGAADPAALPPTDTVNSATREDNA